MKAKVDKTIFEIDPNELDREWLRQAQLVFEYASKSQQARADLAIAQNILEMTKADVDLAIRDDPEAYNIPKVTETAIHNALVLDESVKEATKKVNTCKYNVGVFDVAVSALEHKKRALESLVSLHGQNYFSTPRTDSEGVEKLKEESKKKARRVTRRKRST